MENEPTAENPWKITRESFEVVKKTDPIAGELVNRHIEDGLIVIIEQETCQA